MLIAYLRGVLKTRLPQATEERVDRLAKHIAYECTTRSVDPALVLAVIQVESDFKPNAVSPKGAQGLMQVMPGTARFIVSSLGVEKANPNRLKDPYVNTSLGIAYLAWLWDRYAGNLPHVLGAYNAGPGRVDNHVKKHGNSAPKVTREYIRSVTEHQNYFRALGVEFAESPEEWATIERRKA